MAIYSLPDNLFQAISSLVTMPPPKMSTEKRAISLGFLFLMELMAKMAVAGASTLKASNLLLFSSEQASFAMTLVLSECSFLERQCSTISIQIQFQSNIGNHPPFAHIYLVLYFIYQKQAMKGEGSPENKKNRLQMMSDFARMRFSLKNDKVFQARQTTKKTPYTKFSKSKHKEQQVSPSPANLKGSKEKLSKQQRPSVEAAGDDLSQTDNEPSFRLKYLQKLSNQHILIGNEYQLDMLHINNVKNRFIDVECRWSICPSDLISSLSVDTKYSFIAVSLGKNVDILKYNLKREQHQCPEIIVKSTHEEEVQFVRFVRNMSIFVILQTKIEFYRINMVCQKVELNCEFIHKIDYGPNFKLYHVPQTIDNSLILYFYENRVKPDEQSNFGLWTQLIQARSNADTPIVGKLVLNYNIKVKQRKEVSIFNYNKDICLLKFRYNIIAVKNGFVIDETNTNFRSQNSFIDYAESINKVIHFRKTFIDVYQLTMNLNTKPESIHLECLDSISFQSPKEGKLFKIIELQPDRFALFYQQPAPTSKSSPKLEYFFCVTQETNLNSKIDILYPKKEDIEQVDVDTLKDTCAQAKKLGMSNKEAYYELWRRSNKVSKMDYHILISTEDFGTIAQEVEKKLKSTSMTIRQVINIYAQTLQMLKIQVLGSNCTVNTIIEYSSCQFSLKKFEMLRYIKYQEKREQSHLTESQDNHQALLISIKDYYELCDMSIEHELIELIGSYLNKKSEVVVRKIKALLKYFKLIFLINYMETLTKIINLTKLRIVEILEIVPELLPYHCSMEKGGFGLWQAISEQEKEENLFLYDLMTIDNRDKIKEFPGHLWFKRHLNTSHGVIVMKRSQINSYLKTHLQEDDVFYKFLFQIYNLKTYDQTLRKLIRHIQDNYPLLPQHLKGKFELYIILYQLFEHFNQQYLLEDFLKAKESELFKMYFQREKAEKSGFILKKIMPLYEKILNDGKIIFNQGLYNYFSSEQSTVADLKCILNKLNNQKNEFHISAQNMYEVLINAIMRKIKIGSDNDTPIDEILVYIQNIPFPIHNHSIMTNLQSIQQINYESDILKKIKANMTLQQIVDNPRKIIELMVEYEVNRLEVCSLTSYRSLKLHTFKILSEIQCRKSNIYGDQEHAYSLKVYLINIMISKEMIRLCSKLLKDEYLVQEYSIYTQFIQDLVMILYHWKLNTVEEEEETHYLKHLDYLIELTALLEEDNSKRKYIQYSIKYAELLSFEGGFKIQYPLFSSIGQYPTLNDFTQTINCLSAKELAKIDLQTMFDVILKLKKIKEEDVFDSEQMRLYEGKLKIEVYEHMIVRLIEEKQLKSALDLIFVVLAVPHEYEEYDVILPCLIIEQLIPELLQKSINLLIKTISYYFNSPLQLAQIIKELFSRSFSNQEIDSFLAGKIKQNQKRLIFSPKNPIIIQNLKISGESSPVEVNRLIETCLLRIIKQNQVYVKNYNLHIMYRLMCHHPLVVSKWILCKKGGINVKTLRSFTSFMALELPFDHEATLASGRQIFQMVSFQYSHNIFFSEILRWKQKFTFEQMNEFALANLVQSDQTPLQLINQCIATFHKKIEDLNAEENQQFLINVIKQPQDLLNILNRPEHYEERPLSQYIYKDRDDGYEDVSDQLYIPGKKRNIKHRKGMISRHRINTESKTSLISEKTYFKMEELNVHNEGRGPRKYSEYFPEMLDVQQLGISSSLTRLEPIFTPKQRRTFNFDFQIPEDHNENMPSLVKIASKDSDKVQEKNKNPSLKSIQAHVQINLSPTAIAGHSRQIREQAESDRLSNVESLYLKSQEEVPENGGFQIKIAEKGRPHRPVSELADRIYSTVADRDGRFDLTLLKIESKKPNFASYLFLFLQEIYHNNLMNFQIRMKLILDIAETYQSEYFKQECIQIFKKLAKSKTIPNLSFKMVETVPIELILQQTVEDAFKLFMKQNMQKINSLNIYQALEYVHQLFGDPAFKDRLLLEFITLTLKTRDRDQQKERGYQIALSLFDLFHDLKGSIEKQSTKMSKGNEEDAKLARKLRQLATEYALLEGQVDDV